MNDKINSSFVRNHKSELIIVMIGGIVMIGSLSFFSYQDDIEQNEEMSKLNRLLPNIKSCNDLYSFQTQFEHSNVVKLVNDKFNKLCVEPVFGSIDPNKEMIISGFGKMDCDKLFNDWILNKKPKFYSYAYDEFYWGHCIDE